MFTKIAIIGTGNIGTWLLKTLQNQSNLSVVSVSSRKIEMLPQNMDLYIFSLKDDVYETVLQQIPFKMSHAVHTSGSLSQHILAPFAEKFGVVYPYQTITAEVPPQPNKESHSSPVTRHDSNGKSLDIPICILKRHFFNGQPQYSTL
jgi:threonine dehydrogenase-like Zn-dependent dehydrogenase